MAVGILHKGTPALDAVLAQGNDAGGALIRNVADPLLDQDAATKDYVDDAIAAIVPPATPDLAAVLGAGNDAGDVVITGLSDPVDPTDAATKNYVDGLAPTIPGLATVLGVSNSAGGLRIRNLADPTADQDAATMVYARALHWAPLTNGNPAAPELIFAAGDVVMVGVP